MTTNIPGTNLRTVIREDGTVDLVTADGRVVLGLRAYQCFAVANALMDAGTAVADDGARAIAGSQGCRIARDGTVIGEHGRPIRDRYMGAASREVTLRIDGKRCSRSVGVLLRGAWGAGVADEYRQRLRSALTDACRGGSEAGEDSDEGGVE